ncbi:MAG: hypothetical protein LBT46_14885 [Planctomycetaceae bacterium]|jgi:hypothetical protein|nr:hypothetical protein [Planctomycetaceae bacterium]
MKNSFRIFVVILIAFCLSAFSFAGTDTQGDYTLTVSAGNPAYSPNPALVCEVATDNKYSIYFKLSITKTTARGKEDVSSEVHHCDYSIPSIGAPDIVLSCTPFSMLLGSQHSLTRNNRQFYSAVTPVIKSAEGGSKSVTLNVTAVMEDGITLAASETITVMVVSYGITVFSLVGNILEYSTQNDEYSVDVNDMWTIGLQLGKYVFGHASWKVSVSYEEKTTMNQTLAQYANVPCGFSIQTGTKNISAFLNKIRQYPSTGVSPSSTGQLITNDLTGGKSHNYASSSAQITNALTQVRNIDTTPPTYVLHSHNCVDVCKNIANMAGAGLPDCQKDVVIKDGDSGDEQKAKMSLPNELAKHL